MLNKKGQIAQPLLVALAFVLAGYGLYVFLTASEDYGEISGNLLYLPELYGQSEQYIQVLFADSAKEAAKVSGSVEEFRQNFEKIIAGSESRDYEGGDFFAKIRNGEYEVSYTEGEYNVYVEGVSVKTKNRNNEIVRKVNFRVVVK